MFYDIFTHLTLRAYVLCLLALPVQVLSQVPEVVLYDSVDRVLTTLRLLEYNNTQEYTVLDRVACEDYSFPWESSAGRRKMILSFLSSSSVMYKWKKRVD